MKPRPLTLFDLSQYQPPRERQPRRKYLMVIIDGGPDDCVDEGGPDLIHYECQHCGHDGGWHNRQNKTDALKNRPACPVCNNTEEAKEPA